MLADDVSEMPKNWNRRFKHNRDKIKTGDIYELAEVVRNLALREQEKGLSTGEKQMFTRAKKILASELMYALDKDEEAAEAYLDDLLARLRGGEGGSSRRSETTARWPSRSWWPPDVANALAPRAQGVRRGRRPSDARVVARRAAGGAVDRLGRGRVPPGGRARRASAWRAAPRGSDSVRNALAAAAADDAVCSSTTPRARCVTPARSSSALAALGGLRRGVAAAPVTDTIKEAGEDRPCAARWTARAVGGADAAGVPPRRARASARPAADEVLARATDDAGLVEAPGGRVGVVPAPRGEPQGHDAARPPGGRAAAGGAARAGG